MGANMFDQDRKILFAKHTFKYVYLDILPFLESLVVQAQTSFGKQATTKNNHK